MRNGKDAGRGREVPWSVRRIWKETNPSGHREEVRADFYVTGKGSLGEKNISRHEREEDNKFLSKKRSKKSKLIQI